MKSRVVVTRNGRGRCLEGIMANGGHSENLVIIRGDIKIHVPSSCVYQKKGPYRGQIRKHIAAKLQDLSLENAIALHEEHGIVLEKVNAVLPGASMIIPFSPAVQNTSIVEESFA